jgi:hypothetical protein
MAYILPEWGIWSDQHNTMVERGFKDLDEAKKRVWVLFDAGDETVMVVESCPLHPDRQLIQRLLRDVVACRRRADGGIEHCMDMA